ncbi:hypothetical protein [Anabaena sp. UHCC 0399]|uniref:hypothetical protein n=1 Tax=Anabaena sp. UHCC 0399 TaxID=3110238 RepID=UPI002B1F50E6|nr:hypothetical protein [Anabaena sp. UHCC 0399]MEA5564633.1 hypothetical protein [Anabaena sp. UHCC 0399]
MILAKFIVTFVISHKLQSPKKHGNAFSDRQQILEIPNTTSSDYFAALRSSDRNSSIPQADVTQCLFPTLTNG